MPRTSARGVLPARPGALLLLGLRIIRAAPPKRIAHAGRRTAALRIEAALRVRNGLEEEETVVASARNEIIARGHVRLAGDKADLRLIAQLLVELGAVVCFLALRLVGYDDRVSLHVGLL